MPVLTACPATTRASDGNAQHRQDPAPGDRRVEAQRIQGLPEGAGHVEGQERLTPDDRDSDLAQPAPAGLFDPHAPEFGQAVTPGGGRRPTYVCRPSQ